MDLMDQKVVLVSSSHTPHPLWHAAKRECNCSFFGFWLTISDHGRVGHTALATNWKSIFQQRKSLTFQGQLPSPKSMDMATFYCTKPIHSEGGTQFGTCPRLMMIDRTIGVTSLQIQEIWADCFFWEGFPRPNHGMRVRLAVWPL